MVLTGSDENGELVQFPVIDAHAHLGKEEVRTSSGLAHRVVIQKDILDFYSKLAYSISQTCIRDPNSYYLTLPEDPSAPFNDFQKHLVESSKPTFNVGWLADQIVTFPNNDILRDRTSPKFGKANDRVITRSRADPRFIPYCRLDPADGAQAVCKELQRSVNLGARGLKLHPLSQGFIDEINSETVVEITKMAALLDIPVIFDTANSGVAEEISKMHKAACGENNPNHPPVVILGHFGFDYSSEKMFQILSTDGIFAETSGMRGGDIKIFFRNVTEKLPDSWQDKILFGSDFNYIGVPQSTDFICFLLSKDFANIAGGTAAAIEAARKILGINTLKLVQPFWIPSKSDVEVEPPTLWKESSSNLQKKSLEFVAERGNLGRLDFLLGKSDVLDDSFIFSLMTETEGRSFLLKFLKNSTTLQRLEDSATLSQVDPHLMRERVVKELKKAYRMNKSSREVPLPKNLRDLLKRNGGSSS